MDEGIGRTGYRLLAMIFTALGFLGVAALWLGAEAGLRTITWSGLALAMTAYIVLLAFTMVTPNSPRAARAPRASRSRRRAAPPATAPRPTPASPVPTFEYEDAIPAAPAAPEEMVLPSAFQEPRATVSPPLSMSGGVAFKEHDPAAWPGQKTRDGKSHWTVERQAHEEARRKAEVRGDPNRFADKYTRNTPVVRDILQGEEKRAVPPDGKTRGKCGQCGTVLLAPAKRPLKLKCPTCSKVTLLTA